MSLISVIVPVYKVEKYIHRCVDSILRQTFTDFELILVDDGSPDNCGTICDEYSKKDNRVHVIHQENSGLSVARNSGIDWVFNNSDSQWISFIDSDDWVNEKYLEILLNAVVQTKARMSVCGYKKTVGEELEILQIDNVKLYGPEEFYCNYSTNATATVSWGKLYHKDCFDTIRYPAGKIHEDEFVTYKIIFRNKDIAMVDIPLYAYYMRDSSITNSGWGPNKLVVFEAIEEQIHFFMKNGYDRAYARRIVAYVSTCVSHIKELEKIKKISYRNYEKMLRKKLKRAIYLYRKYLPFEKYKYVYDCAFPNIMQIYWIIYSKKARIKK